MQSVFKFPLALKIFHDIEQGVYSLDQLVHIDEQDWVKGTLSPLRDSCKGQTVNVPLREIIRYTVSASDNNGCDILFRLAGGTGAVQDFIHEKGVRDIVIVATEAQMAQGWSVQYGDWCTPEAMTTLLRLFMEGRILSPASTRLLMQFLVETATGPRRIKGLLSSSMTVAHKTGTSNTNQEGITAATNDVGIITLPDGSHLIISVFVKDAHADETTREAVIARIAAAATCKIPK
jgi:beta-lactamase class A